MCNKRLALYDIIKKRDLNMQLLNSIRTKQQVFSILYVHFQNRLNSHYNNDWAIIILDAINK